MVTVEPVSLLFSTFSFHVPLHGESAAKQGETAAIDSTAAHAHTISFFIKASIAESGFFVEMARLDLTRMALEV
jgi:hypothetical protein